MAPQIIDIPGVGEVEFPETMDDAAISAAAAKLHADAQHASSFAGKAENLQSGIANTIIGAGKRAASTAVNLGRLVHKIPGVSEGVDKLYEMAGVEGVDSGQVFGEKGAQAPAESALGLDLNTTGEKIGGALEQGLEYMAPSSGMRTAVTAVAPRIAGRLIPAMAAEAASGAAVATANGDDPTTAAAMSAAFPVVGAVVGRGARALKEAAPRWALAGMKPTITAMKQTAGASKIGVGKVADDLAQFVIDNRITSPDKAREIITAAEAEIQSMVGGQATDATTRAQRYLGAVRRSAARQGLGADDVASIERAAQQLLEGPMGEDVVTATTRMQPGRTLNAQGQPVMVPVTSHTTTRGIRPTVPADEALRSARSSSKWSTNRAWGEQNGAQTEAAKAVERAQRDAVKTAVPETQPVFAKYSKAIKARDVLERMNFRQSNRDVVGLPSHVIAGAELASGKPPIIATAANYLRNNQLKVGIWADKLANAIKNNDVQTVTEIMGRIGVGVAASPSNMEAELLKR